ARHYQAAAAPHSRGAAGREARGGRRRVDPRLLGLGLRPERLPVGERVLAGAAGRPPVGGRRLGRGGGRLAVGGRPPGRRRAGGGAVPAGAARDAGGRAGHAAALRRRAVGAGQLAVPRRPLGVEAGLLDGGPAGRRLDAIVLRVDAVGLRLRGRLLGPAAGGARPAVRPGGLRAAAVGAAGLVLPAAVLRRPGRPAGVAVRPAVVLSLLLRRLLRPRLPRRRLPAVVRLGPAPRRPAVQPL